VEFRGVPSDRDARSRFTAHPQHTIEPRSGDKNAADEGLILAPASPLEPCTRLSVFRLRRGTAPPEYETLGVCSLAREKLVEDSLEIEDFARRGHERPDSVLPAIAGIHQPFRVGSLGGHEQ
jgi:hypothetical protein